MKYDSLHLSFGNAERLPKLKMMSIMTMLRKLKLCAPDKGVFHLQILCQKNW